MSVGDEVDDVARRDAFAGELAGWWQRVGAALIDALIIGVPTVGVAVATGGLSAHRSAATGRVSTHSTVAYIAAGIVISIAYVACTLCRRGRRNGQSLGDQLVGIRVIRDDGEPFGLSTLLVREIICKFGPGYLLRLLPAISLLWLAIALLDDLWPLWDRENRALHDFAAKTHVVRA